MTKVFNNNFKFHHKNSASPSLCIYAKNIDNVNLPNAPLIQNIITSLNYQSNDFKLFFKIWPNINNTIICTDTQVNNRWLPIRDNWINRYGNECKALEYENKVYHLLDDVKQNPNYTVTPILSDSNNVKVENFAALFSFNSSNPDYNLFGYIFYKWLIDPDRIPNTNFNYNAASAEIPNLQPIENKLIMFILTNLTFSCIMTPVIPNPSTFERVMQNTNNFLIANTSIKEVMNGFCDIFINVIKGIINLKDRHIAHNDLHAGNIFVSRLSDNTVNTFIYDYDRSYATALGRNPILNSDICTNLCRAAQCNIYDNWLDFFKILHYIFISVQPRFKRLLLGIITNSPNKPFFYITNH